MSRIDCISNRNVRIIATYLKSKFGNHTLLWDGIPYPTDRYNSSDDFFLNEDEWTTYQNFHRIFERAKEMSGERYFYFYCGASSASLRSWGRLDYFVRVFTSPSDGFRRLPFFNKNLNDTKDIEVIVPPTYDRRYRKIRTKIRIQYHRDIDVNTDYKSDPYRRGMIAAIPTIWGLNPADVLQPLNPYDPVILLNHEPEFASYGLDATLNGRHLTIRNPMNGQRLVVGQKVMLEAESLNGREMFLGKYSACTTNRVRDWEHKWEAILITETVRVDDRIILKQGEVFKAPHFLLDVTYDRFTLARHLAQALRFQQTSDGPGEGLIETLNRLRESVAAENRAYRELEKVNEDLKAAKRRVDDYARTLEEKVDERTAELRETQWELKRLNSDLEARVDTQVKELERYREMRRYLSPKLTEQILANSELQNAQPRRKAMTVMFSDIRGFSALTENLEPEEIFQLLDHYVSQMTILVHQADGTLNKIIGDGLLVFFGDPVPMDDHAQRAVKLAIEMQAQADELRHEWLQYGFDLGIGIGINTGYMTAGNIGSPIHRDYTVIGHQVNVAARLESMAKPGEILISQRTFSKVKDLVEAELVGEIKVKGIQQPVRTYRVLALS